MDEPTGAADQDATADDGRASAADREPSRSAGSDAEVVPDEDAGRLGPSIDDSGAAEVVDGEGGAPMVDGESSPADEIIELPWDDDLPVALGEETDTEGRDETGADTVPVDGTDDGRGDDGDGPDLDADDDTVRTDEYFARRRHETRRGLESWRTRSATGAIASAIAMGLQQVFEPEKRRPAAVAEAPSDPYSDDDPVTVEYVPDDAEATTVRVKPWLLQKGDPA